MFADGWRHEPMTLYSFWPIVLYEYDRPLVFNPVVRLSVCNDMHCGSQGRCTELKVVPACGYLSVNTLLL